MAEQQNIDEQTMVSACGANVDRFGVTLICALPKNHGGENHNTADDGSGDSFQTVM